MPSRDPAVRSQIARIGAFAQHAAVDVTKTTQPARDAFMRKFEDAVDPGRDLPETERTRRAIAARRAHMLTLALKSARSRTAKAKGAAVEEP